MTRDTLSDVTARTFHLTRAGMNAVKEIVVRTYEDDGKPLGDGAPLIVLPIGE